MRDRTADSLQNSFILRIIGCILGAFIYAVGVNFFIVPANLYTGGLMGFCQVIRTVFFPNLKAFDIAGVLYYIINFPLLLIAWKHLDRKFAIKTIISASSMTLFLLLLPIKQVFNPGSDPESTRLVNSLIGGLIAGAGCGIVLLMGGTSGGVDIIGIFLFKKGKHLSIGQLNLFVNIVLYATCAIIFNIPTAIYSVIYAVLCSFAIDRLHMQNINVEVNIITKLDPQEMEKDIMKNVRRGVTRINAEGGFTGESVSLLYIMVSKYEVTKLRNIVKKHDPNAFVTVKSGIMVYGNYLKKI
ncbi:MAG: YitT family protein [Clostridia bacterium]|nr:YitT family protein [Clostridia bacterium]